MWKDEKIKDAIVLVFTGGKWRCCEYVCETKQHKEHSKQSQKKWRGSHLLNLFAILWGEWKCMHPPRISQLWYIKNKRHTWQLEYSTHKWFILKITVRHKQSHLFLLFLSAQFPALSIVPLRNKTLQIIAKLRELNVMSLLSFVQRLFFSWFWHSRFFIIMLIILEKPIIMCWMDLHPTREIN